ncbi:unnamed protein product [Bursaphelenchus okinawaensis]|uniref:ZP domain-containing protein n=1 Tax=Bursaphelenchus okinawaensis TaxID=465554 RepID=A0A811K7Q4_9BILA|nr:unnamed protein product [Bursaphelenchus okinawaensis]CAG9095001.1 unnamed protein product [Bursaphelenchus okinawaensis]
MDKPKLAILLALKILLCRAFNNLDNSVIGSPVVRCERDYVHFSVPTKKPFNGRVYVKGENQNPHCVKLYGAEGDYYSQQQQHGDERQQHGEDDQQYGDEKRRHGDDSRQHGEDRRDNGGDNRSSLRNDYSEKSGGLPELEESQWNHFLKGKPALDQPQRGALRGSSDCPLVCPPPVECSRKRRDVSYRAELDVELDTCNTIRERIVNPPGVHVSFVVVVSFHTSFVTKIDRAYRVQCAYEETDKTVTTKLDVSMPQTVELSNEMTTPRCEYVMKGRNGNTGNSVQVGDVLDHEWSCSSSSGAVSSEDMGKMFGMLVHDCYIEDGQGQKALVVDSHGCSVDNYILPTPRYDDSKLAAKVSAMVVKFPDKELMTIQCSISVCMKEFGMCDSLTPPKCGGELRNKTKRHIGLDEGWVLSSPQLTVLDPDNSIKSSEEFSSYLQTRETALPHTFDYNEFCLSIKGFGFLIASLTFIVTITLAILLSLVFMSSHSKY